MPDQRTTDDRLLPATRVDARPQPKELVTVRARADIFRHRLDESRERLREALDRFSERTTALNPVTHVRTHPWRWVLGGFGVGIALGWLTRPE